ncbi:MFS general substrate transporter [Aspergillus sclerotiicarbonarius CBS 121057]|uniref:MFS general substrate transporter n=1 Tax=Aspergillus sclerotiicarbonarius (strain CBS 121057 / IBT 28362) TaxID=1448318 RepID=A0A319E328_ASPSB|nr:MFS general substrate transporter [Aspergillus sclerotiicarbonarius CBS 121057]
MADSQDPERGGSPAKGPDVKDSDVEPTAATPFRSEIPADELLVTWDGPDNPECPFNWSLPARWGLTILTSMGGLVTLMSGSMLAPALPSIGKDLNISDSEANMAVSIFVLAFAFGPMVLAPLAEVFGRRNVWLVCSAWYVIWNTVCPNHASE